MPAILTHDLFGRGVLEDATALLNLRTPAERDAFLLGNQGPDPLFYLVVDPLMHKWSPLGSALHDAAPAEVDPSLARKRLPRKDVSESPGRT